MARFADQNGGFDVLGVGDKFSNIGNVGVVGFVAATSNKHDIFVFESLNGDFESGQSGGEIVVIIFDMI